MRNHLINKITEFAGQNENIMLITADLGFSVIESRFSLRVGT